MKVTFISDKGSWKNNAILGLVQKLRKKRHKVRFVHDDRAIPSAYGIATEEGPDYGYDERPIRTFLYDTIAFYRELLIVLTLPFRWVWSWANTRSPHEAPSAREAPLPGISTAINADKQLSA